MIKGKYKNNQKYKSKLGNLFFCIEFNNMKRELFSLNFNKKREMFLVFPSDSTKIIDIYEKGIWKKQRNDDHVTFHKDGTIHTMYKEENRKIKSYRIHVNNENNVFEIDKNSVLPLSVHSFYFKDIHDSLEHIPQDDKKILNDTFEETFPLINFQKNTFTWSLEKALDFSIIIFALGKNLNPAQLPINHPIRSLMNLKYKHPVLLPWSTPETETDDTKLWVIFSSKTTPIQTGLSKVVTDKIKTKNKKPISSYMYSYGICPPWRELAKLN